MPRRIPGRRRAALAGLLLVAMVAVAAAPFAVLTVRSVAVLWTSSPPPLHAVTGLVLIGLPFSGWTLRFLRNLLFAPEAAARALGAKVVTPRMVRRMARVTAAEAAVHSLVGDVARKAGLARPPKVAIVPDGQINAFAVGNRRNYLIALHTGAVERLSPPELAAVVGHEIGHVVHGDAGLKTLALAIEDSIATFLLRPLLAVHGVLRALPAVILGLVLVLGYAIHHADYQLAALVALGLLAPQVALLVLLVCRAVVARMGRWREFHADAAGAALVSTEAMISALSRIDKDASGRWTVRNPLRAPALASFGIKETFAFTGVGRWLFASHPPIRERVSALLQSRYS